MPVALALKARLNASSDLRLTETLGQRIPAPREITAVGPALLIRWGLQPSPSSATAPDPSFATTRSAPIAHDLLEAYVTLRATSS